MLKLFSHVGIIVRDLEASERTWREVLGLQVVARLDVDAEGVRSVMLSTGGAYGETTCIELIEPLESAGTTSVIGKRLTEQGEGVFHLAFRVADSQSAASGLSMAGMKSVILPAAATETQERVVVHPKSVNGVLLELLGGSAPPVDAGTA